VPTIHGSRIGTPRLRAARHFQAANKRQISAFSVVLMNLTRRSDTVRPTPCGTEAAELSYQAV